MLFLLLYLYYLVIYIIWQLFYQLSVNFVILNILFSCWVLDLLNPERLFHLILTIDCQACVQNSPYYLFYLIRIHFRFSFLLTIQHIMNTLGIFDILEYPWSFIIYNISIISLFGLHSMVLNEIAFNLLCGEIQSNLDLRALVVSFKKSLISRTSLKSNLKHRSTSIFRKE